MSAESMLSTGLRSAATAPMRPVRLGNLGATVDKWTDDAMLVRSVAPLGPYGKKLTERLEHWARVAGERVFLAQRDADGEWRTLSYRQVLSEVRTIGAALLQRQLSPERPIVILSGNSIEHALLGLAAMYAGIPYAPISPAYSLLSSDFAKLRAIMELLTPGLVFIDDGSAFAPAIEAVIPSNMEIAVTRNPPRNRSATLLSSLRADPGAAVDAAHDSITPETIAKFLFTSGSTGTPKAVINTHRMLCSNQAMVGEGLQFLHEQPPVLVDWLPWSHTFGGNHNFNMVLTYGGTFHIDEGNPMPAGIVKTERNLSEIAPTIYFNVPRGYDALLPYFRNSRTLRETFFSRLKVLFYAGAGLSQPTWDAIQDLSVASCGERVIFLSSLGSTETAPLALTSVRDCRRPGNIGVPAPGVELKLVPREGKLEARLRGPNITPGYWRRADLTREAFDDEGFYKLGDALRFANPADPSHGFLFDGRMAEDFKLGTGTWVSVGPLRASMLDHFAPFIRDVAIAGANRDELSALVFPNIESCRSLCAGFAADVPVSAVLAHAAVRAQFASLLNTLAASSRGSSTRICRLLLVEAPPSLDAGEMTDKGSINQRAVLSNRAALVDELYARPTSPRVIAIEERS